MKLTINGDPRDFASVRTLTDLILQLGLKHDRIAVERNRELVARSDWATTQLSDGDKLEIVHFVGGGSQVSRSGLIR